MKFLGWLFIILCAQALSSWALEIISSTRGRGFVLSRHLMREQETHGLSRMTSLHGESDGSKLVIKQEKVYLRKGQRGKGSYGGANLVHHPHHPQKSAASLPKMSLFFILSTVSSVLASIWSLFFLSDSSM